MRLKTLDPKYHTALPGGAPARQHGGRFGGGCARGGRDLNP